VPAVPDDRFSRTTHLEEALMRTLIKMLETIGTVFAVSGQRLYAGPMFWAPRIIRETDSLDGGRR
jgi:hypothetical protein